MKKTDTKTGVKAKRPPRTMKEREFARKIIVEHKTPTIAALEVYDVQNSKDPYNTAGTIASQNMQKLTFEHYFHKAGLTDEVIAQNISLMAIKAEKRDHFSGEYEPDYHIRLKATDLAVKVMGKMPKDTGDTNVNIAVVPIIGGMSNAVLADNSNQETIEVTQENSRSAGGDLGEQDDLDSLISD